MKTTLRVIVTIASIIVAMVFLGLLRMAVGSGSDFVSGGTIGLFSILITFGIPWLTWWATGQIDLGKPEK